MSEALYLEDHYLREWDAKVVSANGKFIVLDKTAFYPKGGGQPWDEGTINDFRVIYVGKFCGEISHQVDREGLNAGDVVKCGLDWDRRYKLMRMHSAAHVLSAVFMKEGGAKITGGELGLDKSRDDFGMEEFSKEIVEDYVRKANEIVKRDLPVKTYYMSREEVLAHPELIKLEKGLPEGIERLRIVEIEGLDAQPDGGTHVKSLGEIGEIRIVDVVNKGKNNRRVYFTVK